MTRYEISKTFRLSEDDNRRLDEISKAIGCDMAEALRFALEVTKLLMQHATEDDPEPTFIEQVYGKGRVVFPENMTPEELDDALAYVREYIGSMRFDSLLKRGFEKRASLKRDHANYLKAKQNLLAIDEGPFTFDQIAAAIVKVAGCSLPYAKRILDREFRKGAELEQVKLGQYKFIVQKPEVQTTS